MTRRPADLLAWPLAVRLREHLTVELTTAVAGRPALVAVMPGRDVALDDCCAGQAWVRVIRIYRSSSDEFPQPSTVPHDADRCTPGGIWAVEYGVGVVRCVPGLDGRGRPPTATDFERCAAVMLDDAAHVRSAVLCGLVADVESVVIGDWLPVGPDGGCAGGELSVTVAVDGCGCDHPDSG
jgi:hypothetical protein